MNLLIPSFTLFPVDARLVTKLQLLCITQMFDRLVSILVLVVLVLVGNNIVVVVILPHNQAVHSSAAEKAECHRDTL